MGFQGFSEFFKVFNVFQGFYKVFQCFSMFEGDSADTCTGKFPLVLMGGRVEGLAFADPEARTPIGASGNYFSLFCLWLYVSLPRCFKCNDTQGGGCGYSTDYITTLEVSLL